MFIIVTWNSWIESLISQTWLAFDFNSPFSLSSCVTLSCKLFTWLCASAILFKEKQRKGQRLGLRLWDCDGRKLYLWKTHMTDWHRRKMSYLTEIYTVYTNLMSLLLTSPNEEDGVGVGEEELREITCAEDADLLSPTCFWSWEFLLSNSFNLASNLALYNIKTIYCKINPF